MLDTSCLLISVLGYTLLGFKQIFSSLLCCCRCSNLSDQKWSFELTGCCDFLYLLAPALEEWRIKTVYNKVQLVFCSPPVNSRVYQSYSLSSLRGNISGIFQQGARATLRSIINWNPFIYLRSKLIPLWVKMGKVCTLEKSNRNYYAEPVKSDVFVIVNWLQPEPAGGEDSCGVGVLGGVFLSKPSYINHPVYLHVDISSVMIGDWRWNSSYCQFLEQVKDQKCWTISDLQLH